MQPETQVLTDTVSLSQSAMVAVNELLSQRKMEGHGLRVYIAGRTCSGLQYGMALDDNPGETDLIFETDGIKVIVDNQSIEYMRGSTIEFIDDERGKGYIVNNPNILPSCSCESGSCG